MIATTTNQKPDATTWQWHRHNFRAMNTNVHTVLLSQTSNAILPDVERLFASYERRLSRFLPDSDLSELNNCPDETYQASPTLFGVLEAALWAAELTGGLYDPTILTALEQAGYDRSFEQLTTPRPLVVAEHAHSLTPSPVPVKKQVASFQQVYLNAARREINRPVGVKLDLGGIGKGWTVDRAADRLQGVGPFLVNAGGDIYAYQSPPGQKGWAIDLVHPFKPGRFMAQVVLNHQALATSTIARRRWQQDDNVMHHLIDPRCGAPAQTDAVSVSIIANRTTLAEVIAKTVLILGVEQGLDYLQRLPGVEGLIYTTTGEIVLTGGMTTAIGRLVPEGYSLPDNRRN
jgi:thiamine biosynthesis lipoprotein